MPKRRTVHWHERSKLGHFLWRASPALAQLGVVELDVGRRPLHKAHQGVPAFPLREQLYLVDDDLLQLVIQLLPVQQTTHILHKLVN